MDVAMRVNPQDKMINKEHPMEKWVVRKAFEDMLGVLGDKRAV
jgi:asparagine synthase (glutamine-hydrolysing)